MVNITEFHLDSDYDLCILKPQVNNNLPLILLLINIAIEEYLYLEGLIGLKGCQSVQRA